MAECAPYPAPGRPTPCVGEAASGLEPTRYAVKVTFAEGGQSPPEQIDDLPLESAKGFLHKLDTVEDTGHFGAPDRVLHPVKLEQGDGSLVRDVEQDVSSVPGR
jgi:hypothetical protein